MTDRLDGRIALVTGGGRGIGRATAAGQAAGARVAVLARSAPAATAQAELAAQWAHPDPEAAPRDPPDPLAGYQLLEITIPPGSSAAG